MRKTKKLIKEHSFEKNRFTLNPFNLSKFLVSITFLHGVINMPRNCLYALFSIIGVCIVLGCNRLEKCSEAATRSDCVAENFNDFFCFWGKKDESSQTETCNLDLKEADKFCKAAVLKRNDEATCKDAEGKDFDCVYIKPGIQAPIAICKAAVKIGKQTQSKPE